MPLPTKTIANQGTIVELIMLPDGVRVPTLRTLTLTSGAAIGATSLSIATLPTSLGSESKLKFGSTNVVLTDGAQFQATSLAIEPLTAVLATGATATTLGLRQLLGVTDSSINSSTNTVDVSNFKSGYGMESKTTGVDRTVSVSLNQIDGDFALDRIIKPILFDDAFAEREVYVQITRPNGEKYEGAAQVRNVNQPTAMRDVAKMTLEFQFQGKSFKFTPRPAL